MTVDGDGSSLGTLTIQSGTTIRQYPDAALRVWGNLAVAGAPTSRVVFTTALGTRTGNGIWINSGWGEINVQYADFTYLNRGCFVGWTYTPTVRVSFTQCLFSNIVDRAFDLLDGIGHQVLRVSDSAVVDCGTTLYTDRGGSMTFSNVLFRNTGSIRFVNWGNNALFENCAMIGMRKSGTVQPISGAGAGALFRHCTVVGGDGVGVAASDAVVRDSIIWGHLEQAIGSPTITASYSCIEGGYIGPGSNNLMLAPGFIGWSSGATVFVDAAASCPGDGSMASPFCSLANAIAQYRAGFNYGLTSYSPCIGAASDGGNIGAQLGVGAAGATSIEIRVAPGTYGLGGHNLLMGISLIGAGPNSVVITNTIKGLQTGARLEGVTVASTAGKGLELNGPKSPAIVNCVFSNLADTAIYIYNGNPTSVEVCAPTITAVRIRDIYSASSPVDGMYIDGSSASWKTRPEIRNGLFHNIRSGASGRQGAVHAFYASPLVLNSTFYTNKIGLCSEYGGTVTVWNCISYQNSTADIWNYMSAFRIGHSDYGTYSVATPASLWTTNNLNADPQFANRSAFDLRLLPASPCINRGTNQEWMVGANDFFGNPRLLHRFVDIGAYEHLFEGPFIGVYPTAMTVRAATTDTLPDRHLDVWNAGANALNYTISSNVPWLSLAPTSGTSTGETDTITVAFQTAGLAAGTHTGLITITDSSAVNSPLSVPVVLQLQAPAIRCTPTGYAFAVTTGGAFPPQVLQISNAKTGTMNYVISTNASWLSVTPVSGVSTGETDIVNVSFQTEPLAEGAYTGLVTVTSADATNSPVTIPVLVKVLDFNRALNTTNLPWRSSGNIAWFVQTNTTHDGTEAAQSGPISHSHTSWVEVALNGPAKLSFWWRVSSENNFDFLRFYIDTTVVASISGTTNGWIAQTNIIADGTHLIRWAYTKDSSVSPGMDCGWLDEVRYLYDSDGDGLPDVFEEQYWGDPISTHDWNGDSDGDGYSNGDEFLADSNPLDNSSMPPRFTNVTVGVLSRCDISPTSTQRFYQISATTNLSGAPSWIPMTTHVRGNAGALEFWVTNDAPLRFYRAVITRPP